MFSLFMNRMDARDFYMQNCFVYARRIGISIGEYIDGNFNRTLHRYIMPLRFHYVKVNAHALCLFAANILNDFHSQAIRLIVHISFSNIFNRQYKVAVTMIWLIALSVNLPWLYVFQLEPIELGSNRKVSNKNHSYN